MNKVLKRSVAWIVSMWPRDMTQDAVETRITEWLMEGPPNMTDSLTRECVEYAMRCYARRAR